MPELPEVETITRELSRAIVGKKLSKFSVFDTAKMTQPRLVLPQRIISVRRRGKFIILDLNGGPSCFIHLRMTGGLFTKSEQSNMARHKHERARFYFHDGSALIFHDVRRFGTIEWRKKEQPLPQLGIEPLSRQFTAQAFGQLLKNKTQAVKSSLLNQKLIAGIGNIYADESLWSAKIHPKRIASTLSVREVRELVRAVRHVLREAIKKGGSTLRDYRRIDGGSGSYQKSRKVYGREGGKCLRCGGKIKRIRVGGRSSYFCPVCQRAKRV